MGAKVLKLASVKNVPQTLPEDAAKPDEGMGAGAGAGLWVQGLLGKRHSHMLARLQGQYACPVPPFGLPAGAQTLHASSLTACAGVQTGAHF